MHEEWLALGGNVLDGTNAMREGTTNGVAQGFRNFQGGGSGRPYWLNQPCVPLLDALTYPIISVQLFQHAEAWGVIPTNGVRVQGLIPLSLQPHGNVAGSVASLRSPGDKGHGWL